MLRMPKLPDFSSIWAGVGGFAGAGRQMSAGAVVGLSAVIYSLSYGALLFSGSLAPAVGFGITVALISAALGALFGLASEEKTFIAGPDSNTISVLASIVAVSGSVGLTGVSVDLAIAMVIVTSVLAALAFYGVAWANLAGMVRYIPFPVTAGFLVSTGWLMASGALNIIVGTPFSMAGLQTFMADPLKPQLGFGLLTVGSLYLLGRIMPSAVLIPVVMGLAAIVVNVGLESPLCGAGACAREAWTFPRIGALQWLPPWEVAWGRIDYSFILRSLPEMMVVAFVGLLTILLSVASLELNFQREFSLNRVLKTHAMFGAGAALLGGFMPVISIGRTTVCRQTGGGGLSGLVAAAICLAMLLGAGSAIAYMPKAALGALVLFLGINLMKQWLWDSRAALTRFELAQILLILGLVANFGFMVGFAAGVFISCGAFIVAYSRIPLVRLAANVALLTSSVVRPAHEVEALQRVGRKVLVYKLGGYVFFGSASEIANVFKTLTLEGEDAVEGVVIDFTDVSGIDSSAISVFRRILSTFRGSGVRFYLVYSAPNEMKVRSIGDGDAQVAYDASLDHAIERAEDALLDGRPTAGAISPLTILGDDKLDALFLSQCERRHVVAGGVLCAEGEQSDSLFFVESGGLEVVKVLGHGATVRLAKLHQGAMAGELAFYTGEARTAAIIAAEDSQVYVLTRRRFERLRLTHPDIATRFDHLVIGRLARTLGRTNKLLAMYR